MKRKLASIGFIKLYIFFVLAAFILFTLTSNVLAATTTCSVYDLDPFADDCAGQIDGNDSVAALNRLNGGDGLFDYNNWVFLQKSEAGGGLETNIDVGLSVTTNNGFQSGSWSVTSDLSARYHFIAVVLKGGPAWVGYLYDPSINGGEWTTAGLINPGGQQPDLSHLSLYAGPMITCVGDFDKDGDVDGEDLKVQTAGGTGVSVKDFAAEFGRIDCPKKTDHEDCDYVDELPSLVTENDIKICLNSGNYYNSLTVNGNDFSLIGKADNQCGKDDGWTIIHGSVTINGDNATFKNIKFKGEIEVNGNDTNFINCYFLDISF